MLHDKSGNPLAEESLIVLNQRVFSGMFLSKGIW
jgi:hypothetical protein